MAAEMGTQHHKHLRQFRFSALYIQLYTGNLTCQNLLESFDGLLQGHQLPQMTCEDLSNLEWLRQETLYFPCTRHSQLVFLRKFIHTQDGDDVLEGFVVL